MYASYLKERENVDVLETDKGFAIYVINNKECYIRDIYVLPEYRHQKVASQIADEIYVIAKNAGCEILTGTVCPSAKGSTDSIQVLIGYGMKLHSSSNNLIVFSKDII